MHVHVPRSRPMLAVLLSAGALVLVPAAAHAAGPVQRAGGAGAGAHRRLFGVERGQIGKYNGWDPIHPKAGGQAGHVAAVFTYSTMKDLVCQGGSGSSPLPLTWTAKGFPSKQAAQANCSLDSTCMGVYDAGCDGRGAYYTCRGNFKRATQARHACVSVKQPANSNCSDVASLIVAAKGMPASALPAKSSRTAVLGGWIKAHCPGLLVATEDCTASCAAAYTNWWTSCGEDPAVRAQNAHAGGVLEYLAARCLATLPPATTKAPSPARATVDHSLWAQVLRQYLRVPGGTIGGIRTTEFDYASLRSQWNTGSPSTAFRRYLHQLETINLTTLDKNELKALFANAYNAFVVKLIVSHNCSAVVWPPKPRLCSSIRDIKADAYMAKSASPAPWDIPIGRVGLAGTGTGAGGEDANLFALDQLEHGFLRAGCAHNDHPRILAALPRLGCDPRLHSALNCGSASCPDLLQEPFTGAGIDSQLDAHVRGWLANPGKGLSVKSKWGMYRLNVSSLFKWYAGDFGAPPQGVKHFIAKYAPGTHQGSTHLTNAAHILASTGTTYMDYNWDMNAADKH